jgi:hypothetical protein
MTCPTSTLDQLVQGAAEALQAADHAYQLALANGDPKTVSHALQFWRMCMADYHELKQRQFRRGRRRRTY